MSPIPGSNNSKEDEETIGPFPLSNFDAPHEHPTGCVQKNVTPP